MDNAIKEIVDKLPSLAEVGKEVMDRESAAESFESFALRKKEALAKLKWLGKYRYLVIISDRANNKPYDGKHYHIVEANSPAEAIEVMNWVVGEVYREEVEDIQVLESLDQLLSCLKFIDGCAEFGSFDY